MAYALVLGTKFCGFESHHQYQYGGVAKRLRHLVHTEEIVSSNLTAATNIYGGVFAPAGNLVLKTSGTRDGMGIDTSLRRQI